MDDVVALEDLGRTQVAVAGGKGAGLGELTRIEGIRVPAGFCVTTGVYRRIVVELPGVSGRLDRLSQAVADDRAALGAEIRSAIEAADIPGDLAAAITARLAGLGEEEAYAVRSSATAEDLPGASFAGQQESYLNISGAWAVLDHVRRCWASLFTERAIAYRVRNGIDHRSAEMAVVVQRMVAAEAAGVMFTADPVTSNRTVVSIEAVPGLGEALVSGQVNPDVYKVRGGAIASAHHEQRSLADPQVLELAAIGRRIEEHLGAPQDIEWCLADGRFEIVQSRPITTLFPVPEAADAENRVYVSVGHNQMMTEAMKPLGIAVWQLTSPAPMRHAGGRLFVDVTPRLASPATRPGLLELMGRGDPLMRDALEAVIDREDFPLTAPDDGPAPSPPAGPKAPAMPGPAIVGELIADNEQSLAKLKRDIPSRSGAGLLDFILEDLQELRRLLFDPRNHQAIMAGIEATWWLNDQLEEWLGETNAADKLAQSAPGNVTSEMGLALLDVADAIRPHPAVVVFLEQAEGDGFVGELARVDGGREAQEAIRTYLDRYGMRCVGEIDITRTRWSEHPAALLPMILSNVRNFEQGEGERRFQRGAEESRRKEREILQRLQALPDGAAKADQTKAMIDQVRAFIGYREYPKYGMVSRYFVYKLALLGEAERLVGEGVLGEAEDIYYLTFQELHEVARARQADRELIRERREAFQSFTSLRAPRVLTSDGEGQTGEYRRGDVPADSLVGNPVSAGTVEGRARVVLDVADADLEVGDILVTTSTDPSWTPLFVSIGGLVTEVGGLMTHGAVIAREYGLPAVVGVENVTELIADGQRIRVNGAGGYVEILTDG